ncbi:sulfite reductase (NADPH) flavoprotein alpha-component [Algoriella xinjiangensis]|uniref:assimilatory sulfite reductase (NADPH) n=1 Tax=Algoriella xinjiangensis TaxID=684065 RepID=A0A1I4X8N3_9FLAO|nr:flavodoxin domain-containing protein [Algoriella xinjiangensis]SFN22224.1 sulfite reductase (NADPH) flavoprotein alpha-component [Algoriella xinjiangensis]VDH14798.1 Sulfite reductase [NADPH] flavoprotein alpha-component [Algoriella xinjiangensis]
MLANEKLLDFKNLIKDFSRDEIIWTNGYLAGILVNNQENKLPEVAKINLVKPTIIYGTETGNAKKLATQLQSIFKKNKVQSKVVDAFQYPLEKIEKEEFIIFIISTQGDGDLPQNAQKFYDNLSNLNSNLASTKYAVLGLGDTSYPFFCKSGEEIDELFHRLGANRAISLVKTDIDYQPIADEWFAQILNLVQNSGQSVLSSETKISAVSYKKNYEGIVKHKVILNDKGSNKETYHIEIALDEQVDYEPGDALGIYPKNNPIETSKIAHFFDAESRYKELELKNIRALSKKSIEAFAQLFKIEIKEEKVDLIDVLNRYELQNITVNFDAVLALLHSVAPRLYSISSSTEAHENEIHLTVSLDTFEIEEQQKTGLCSQFLADFEVNHSIEFYIHKNKNFKLPTDDEAIIMIGPGTGIAPFRSFLAHRDATGSEGKNWLFFGEQHFVSDFYYQTEIQEWLSTGVLQKLDTAFSRDQKEKIYVQNRVKEQAKEIFEWIDNGAYLYVCGQKNGMSTDVENTLVEIIATEKDVDTETAKNYLEKLEEEGRYQKDVY